MPAANKKRWNPTHYLKRKKRMEKYPSSFFVVHLLLGEVFLTALLAVLTGFPTVLVMFEFLGTGMRDGAGGVLIDLSIFSIIKYF